MLAAVKYFVSSNTIFFSDIFEQVYIHTCDICHIHTYICNVGQYEFVLYMVRRHNIGKMSHTHARAGWHEKGKRMEIPISYFSLMNTLANVLASFCFSHK